MVVAVTLSCSTLSPSLSFGLQQDSSTDIAPQHRNQPSDIIIVGQVDGTISVIDALSGNILLNSRNTGGSMVHTGGEYCEARGADSDSTDLMVPSSQALLGGDGGHQGLLLNSRKHPKIIPSLDGSIWSISDDAQDPVRRISFSAQEILDSNTPIEVDSNELSNSISGRSLLTGSKVVDTFALNFNLEPPSTSVGPYELTKERHVVDQECPSTLEPHFQPLLYISRVNHLIKCLDAYSGLHLWNVSISSFTASVPSFHHSTFSTLGANGFRRSNNSGGKESGAVKISVSPDGRDMTARSSSVDEIVLWQYSSKFVMQTGFYLTADGNVHTIFDAGAGSTHSKHSSNRVRNTNIRDVDKTPSFIGNVDSQFFLHHGSTNFVDESDFIGMPLDSPSLPSDDGNGKGNSLPGEPPSLIVNSSARGKKVLTVAAPPPPSGSGSDFIDNSVNTIETVANDLLSPMDAIYSRFFVSTTEDGIAISWRGLVWVIAALVILLLVAIAVGVSYSRRKYKKNTEAEPDVETTPQTTVPPAPQGPPAVDGLSMPAVPQEDNLSIKKKSLPPAFLSMFRKEHGTNDILRRSLSDGSFPSSSSSNAAPPVANHGLVFRESRSPGASPRHRSNSLAGNLSDDSPAFSELTPPAVVEGASHTVTKSINLSPPVLPATGAVQSLEVLNLPTPIAISSVRNKDSNGSPPLGPKSIELAPSDSKTGSISPKTTMHEIASVSSAATVDMMRDLQVPVCVKRYANEFEEGAQLGHGGFGSVFVSRNRLDGREYAIKKVRVSSSIEWEGKLKKVLREVQVLAMMDHENIVRYYQAWLERVDGSEHVSLRNEGEETLAEESEVTESSIHLSEVHKRDKRHSRNVGSFGDFSDDGKGNFFSLDRSGVFSKNDDFSKGESKFDESRESMDGFEFVRDGDEKEQAPNESSFEASHSHEKRNNKASRISFSSDNSRSPEFTLKTSPGLQPKKCRMKVDYDLMLYIQMQYCTQKTLSAFLSNTKRDMDYMDIVSKVEQIARGIQHVHENGIIHRDLKPANIFFVDDKRIRLGDFGLSRHTANMNNPPDKVHGKKLNKAFSNLSFMSDDSRDLDESFGGADMTSGMGTYLYSSPEQVSGQAYTEKTDLYSLGMIMFELMHRPFGTSMERIIVMSKARTKVFPEEWTSDKSIAPLLDMVKPLLSSVASERPSASEVAATCEMMLGKKLKNDGISIRGDNDSKLFRVLTENRSGLFDVLRSIISESNVTTQNCSMFTKDGNFICEFAFKSSVPTELLQEIKSKIRSTPGVIRVTDGLLV
jgi:serine/threonine protein kinase